MISYIKGTISFKNPTFILVEAGGIGYHVNISLNTYARIEKLENIKILTHLLVREDSHTLYGFADDAERTMFVHLISVSGVGPTTAQIVLSSLTTEDLRSAIIGENVALFQKVKGIGPKTAKRIILDLKDKMLKDGGDTSLTLLTPQDNTMREEALSALSALGFNRIAVQKTLNQLLRDHPGVGTVEELIKLALKQMS
ncbi:MAG: Holliday junction branch migration protein RuvA [Saprospiraceae bacterium]|nr:Holliday junction branch migration protein RuvA [Saprospiraceae bacterium]MDZ4704934.1 Holliday junction branch migration protein RuvA [Saprospiraceae bacterium]